MSSVSWVTSKSGQNTPFPCFHFVSWSDCLHSKTSYSSCVRPNPSFHRTASGGR